MFAAGRLAADRRLDDWATPQGGARSWLVTRRANRVSISDLIARPAMGWKAELTR